MKRYLTLCTVTCVVLLLISEVRGVNDSEHKGGTTGEEEIGRGLWFTAGPFQPPPNPTLKNLTCPGTGRFALKKSDSCGKYYECPLAFRQPTTLLSCPKTETFNRISRTCVPKEYGNCKWCLKEGRHTDKTSKKHYIECVGGTVGIRYRCKDGKFDYQKKQCIKTELKNITDVMLDVVYDPPVDIVQFMKDWKDAEEEQKEEKKLVSKSIEGSDGNDDDEGDSKSDETDEEDD